MAFQRDVKETAQVGCLAWIMIAFVAVALIVIGVVQTGLHYAAMPWLRQQETAINRSSQGYVDAKQTLLVKLTQDAYRHRAEIAERKAKGADTEYAEVQLLAALDVIEQEAATLQPSQIPSSTRDLMALYGRFI